MFFATASGINKLKMYVLISTCICLYVISTSVNIKPFVFALLLQIKLSLYNAPNRVFSNVSFSFTPPKLMSATNFYHIEKSHAFSYIPSNLMSFASFSRIEQSRSKWGPLHKKHFFRAAVLPPRLTYVVYFSPIVLFVVGLVGSSSI